MFEVVDDLEQSHGNDALRGEDHNADDPVTSGYRDVEDGHHEGHAQPAIGQGPGNPPPGDALGLDLPGRDGAAHDRTWNEREHAFTATRGGRIARCGHMSVVPKHMLDAEVRVTRLSHQDLGQSGGIGSPGA